MVLCKIYKPKKLNRKTCNYAYMVLGFSWTPYFHRLSQTKMPWTCKNAILVNSKFYTDFSQFRSSLLPWIQQNPPTTASISSFIQNAMAFFNCSYSPFLYSSIPEVFWIQKVMKGVKTLLLSFIWKIIYILLL